MPSTVHNAQTGEHITFLSDDGDVLQMRFVIDGGGLVAAEHFHPEQEERFEVVTGTLRMRLNGQEREVQAGERVVVPAGVPHAWWNTSPTESAEVRIDLEPALESRAFFETLFQMVEDGHTKGGMPRNPVRLAVLAQRLSPRSAGRARRGGPAREAARSGAPRARKGDGPRRPCFRLSSRAAIAATLVPAPSSMWIAVGARSNPGGSGRMRC